MTPNRRSLDYESPHSSATYHGVIDRLGGFGVSGVVSGMGASKALAFSGCGSLVAWRWPPNSRTLGVARPSSVVAVWNSGRSADRRTIGSERLTLIRFDPVLGWKRTSRFTVVIRLETTSFSF